MMDDIHLPGEASRPPPPRTPLDPGTGEKLWNSPLGAGNLASLPPGPLGPGSSGRRLSAFGAGSWRVNFLWQLEPVQAQH